MAIRNFQMVRVNDESGVSGTGTVLEGTIFSDGTCVTRWIAADSPGRSTSLWDSLGAFIAVHIAPHPTNQTKLVFSDGEVYEHTASVKAGNSKSDKPVSRTRRTRKNKVSEGGVQDGTS